MTDLSDMPVAEVLSSIEALDALLQQEFELLKSRDLDALERTEVEKNAILQRLEPLAPCFLQAEELSSEWVQAREGLRVCRDKHFLNLQLLRRQMDAVQGALQALLGDAFDESDLYNRQGHIKGHRGLRAYAAA